MTDGLCKFLNSCLPRCLLVWVYTKSGVYHHRYLPPKKIIPRWSLSANTFSRLTFYIISKRNNALYLSSRIYIIISLPSVALIYYYIIYYNIYNNVIMKSPGLYTYIRIIIMIIIIYNNNHMLSAPYCLAARGEECQHGLSILFWVCRCDVMCALCILYIYLYKSYI